MDYFKFDLQLFADPITVDMSKFTATGWLGDDGTLYTSWTDEAKAATLIAHWNATNKKLTAVAADDVVIIVKTTTAGAVGLDSDVIATVTTAEGFGEAAGAPEYPDPATTCTISFADKDGVALGTVSEVTTGVNEGATSTIGFDADTLALAQLTANCVVDDMTAKGGETKIVLSGTEGASALISGAAEIAAGASFKAGANAYTNASVNNAEPAVAIAADVTAADGKITFTGHATNKIAFVSGDATITATTATKTVQIGPNGTVAAVQDAGSCKVEFAAGKTATIIATAYPAIADATITVAADGEGNKTVSLTAGSVTLGNGVAITNAAGTAKVANGTTNAITVDKDGNVTGLVAGASFTTTVSAADRTYTATATGIAVTGAEAAVYTVTPASAKVDAATKKVYTGTTELTALPLTLTLAAASAATTEAKKTVKTYYALNNDGTVATTPVTADDYPALAGNVIGYFQVTTTFDGSNEANVPNVAVAFKSGTATKYTGKITVNTAAIANVTYTPTAGTPVVQKLVDTVAIGEIAPAAADIAVTGLKHGTAVTGAGTTTYEGGLWYAFATGGSNLSEIELSNTAGTYYYSVAFAETRGTVSVQLVNYTTTFAGLTDEQKTAWLAANNYFVVTKTDKTASKAGSVKINYVQNGDTGNGKYSLYGMTTDGTHALDIPVVATAVTATTVSSIDFDSRMSGLVNNVVVNGIKAGITLTDGGTTVTSKAAGYTTPDVVSLGTFDYGYKNAITLDVTALSYDNLGVATVTIGDSVDETTRVKTLKNGAAGTTDYGSYTVTRAVVDEEAGTYSYEVTYTPGAGVDLSTLGAALDGKTAIDLKSSTAAVSVDMTAIDKVVNATPQLTTLTVAGGANIINTAEGTGQLVYTKSSAFAYGTDEAISFNNIWTAGVSAGGKHTYYYQVRKGAPVKGVTTYTVYDKTATVVDGASTEGTNVNLTQDSYFIATYDDNTGAIVMTYHEGTTNKVTAAELAAVGAAVKVDGATVDTETATTAAITKKLTLTETIPCNVADLPATVKTVDTKDVKGSDYNYKDTYNVTTTIELGTKTQTQWYRVVVADKDKGTKANFGVNTATLASPVTTEPTVAQKKDNNYVKVDTNGSAISIEFLPATDPKKAFDFDGQKITVDPTKAASDATITIQDDGVASSGDDAVFVIKNLSKGQHTVVPVGPNQATTDPASGTAAQYTTSYALAYTPEVDDARGIKADGLKLTGTTGTKTYYTVTKSAKSDWDTTTGGVITYTIAYGGAGDAPAFAGVDTPAPVGLVGYITVNNGTATGITISYSSNGEDISGIGESIAINAKKAADTVIAIDLSNSGSKINYALTDMKSGVEVVNPGKNDTYAQLAKLDLTGQVLKLANEKEAYWTISASGTISKTTTEPKDGQTNYFSVTKPTDSSTYTIKYVEAGNGTAYDLTATALTIDASGVAMNEAIKLDLSNGTRAIQYHVTGAPAGLTLQNYSDTPAKTADTISYTSTFSAWPTPATKGPWKYTYFTPTKDSAGEDITDLTTSNTAVTVAPLAEGEAAKKYNKVTVTVTGDAVPYTYAIAITGVEQTPTGVLVPNDAHRSVKKITVPSSYKNIDARELIQANMVLAGVDDKDTVTVDNAGSLANLTISGTGSFTIKNVTVPATPVSTTYKASTGTISVKNNTCVSGVFVLAEDEVLTANNNANGATVTVTGDDAEVAVTFGSDTDAGKIMSITGLDGDETVVVTRADTSTVTYTYNAETGLVTKVDSSAGTTYAGADGNTVDIIGLNYQAAATPIETTTFKWTNGTYYVAYTGTAATIEKDAGTAGQITSGSYIKATVAGDVLTLAPVTGTRAHTENANADFAGTITVNAANGVPITYVKGVNDKFALAFTNVSDGSKFTTLSTGDKVTTAALAQGAMITLNDGTNDAKYTTAADDSTLVFENGKIVSGTVTLTNGSGTLIGTNEKISIAAGGNGVQVVFKNGAIDSITKFSQTDSDGVITLVNYTTDDEGDDHVVSTTTYTAASDTAITKQVVKANGDTETSTITIVKDADILKGSEALKSVAIQVNMNPGAGTSSTGYIEVGKTTPNTAEIADDTASAARVLDAEADAGKQFVRTTVTNNSGVYEVELTALIYKNGELTTTGADASKIAVTFNAAKTAAPTKIKYNGENDSFKSIAFENVAAGSEFIGLSKGDTVKADDLAKNAIITVNGTEYKALDDTAANNDFLIYAENSRTTYIVNGGLDVTGEVVSVDTADPAKKKYTLNYSTSSKAAPGAAGNDGVHVEYAAGLPTITDLEDGEKVTVLNAETNKTTTFERKSTYLYVTDEGGRVWGKDGGVAVPAYSADLTTFRITLTGATYENLTDKDPVTGQFLWSDTATKTATGYFLLEGKDTKTATVADQSAKTSIDYTNAGEVYLVASVGSGDVHALTLTTQEVNYDGSLKAAAALVNTQAVTINGIAGRTITYTRGNEKSIALNGVGKNTVISGAMKAGDVVTTAALKAGDKVTIGTGNVFTAGADTTMAFAGANATAGTFLLNTGAATLTTTTTDADGNVTVMTVTYDKNTYTGDVANQNVAVTVSNGRVTGITGLEASPATPGVPYPQTGEKVTVVTTVTDKFGVPKTTTSIYTAAASKETGKTGQVVVTRDLDGTKSTHTFANGKQNILDSSTVWETDAYVTKLDFDWGATSGTGYFETWVPNVGDDKNKYVTNVSAQVYDPLDPDTYIDKTDEGKVFLKVVATKASASSPAVISSMSLVKVEANGALADFTNGVIGSVWIDASATAGGLELPTHTNVLDISGAQNNASYKGLLAADKLAGTGAGTYTVNGTKYVTTTAFGMNGAGEMTVGTFKIAPEGTATTATAVGSAKPRYDADTVTKTLVYTPGADNKDGVAVTFANGEIDSVKDLEPGEKVVITNVKGASMALNETTTITKDDDNLVTKTIAHTGFPTDLVMTMTDNGDENVFAMEGFTVSNKFDFGATTAGKIGIIPADGTAVTIATQAEGHKFVAGDDGKYFMAVGATTDTSTKAVTISYLEVLKYNDETKDLDTARTGALAGGVTIAAPTEGNLTLSGTAVQLYKVYYDENSIPPVAKTDPKYGTLDERAGMSDKERGYGIAVTGAVKGKSYSGFGEKDTVTGALVKGDTITVNSKTLTLADDNAILIRGDGKAINGVYTLGSGVESAANVTAAEADQFTAKITGTSTAVVKLSDGGVDSIKGLTAVNQSVTIVSTKTKTGAVTTTAYTVTAVDATTGDLTIKREITDDGVKTTVTGTAGKNDSITDASWGAPAATLTSTFDWTSAKGSGYFLTEVTDSSKKLGTVEVKPATTTAEVGKYYLKVSLSGDGAVSGLTLHKIKADGSPDADVIGSVTEGTIKVTAPTAAPLTLDMTGAPAAVVFNVTGAITKSVITMDNAKDTLTTANLAAGDFVTVNTKKLVSAGGALEFTGANGGLANGTVKFDKDTTVANLAITTTKATVTVTNTLGAVAAADQAAETPTVTVKDGVVTSILGVTKYNNGAVGALVTTVAVQDTASGITSTYSTDASKRLNVAFTALAAGKDIVTAKLEKDATLTGGGLNGFTVAEPGSLALHTLSNAQFQVFEGTLKFNAGAAATVTRLYVTGNDTSVTTDDKIAVFTTGTTGYNTVTMKVENGVITSVKGLRKGDVLVYNDITYTAVSSTVITKEYTDASGAHKVTAYLSAVDGDIIGASYAVVSDDDISNNESYEGQFSWMAVDGRSTGYFKITDSKTASTATIAEQSTKSSPTAGKNAVVKYVKANTAADETAANRQVLTIGALQVTGSADGKSVKVSETDASKILTAATKITVTAPTAAVNGVIPAVNYTKAYEDKYNVVINKVAKDSLITGLTAGDKVTTATLNAPARNAAGIMVYEKVTMTNGKDEAIDYVAGAKGALEFLGEGASNETAADSTNTATLVKGTILLDTDIAVAGTNNTAILSGSADGALADITVTLDDSGTAVGAGNCQDKVTVVVGSGKVSSITGLETKGNKLTLTPTGGTAVVYEVLNREPAYDANGNEIANTIMTMVSRTEGTSTTYATFTLGKNIYGEVNAKTGAISNGYKTVAADTPTNTATLWTNEDKKGQVVYVAVDTTGDPYTANFAQVATDAINAKEAERGKKYLAMTVKTTNGVSTIQKIEVAEVDADGSMKVVKNMTVKEALTKKDVIPHTVGSFTINGAKDTGFAKINYAIPSTLTVPVTITNAAIGSAITGVKNHENRVGADGDQITTAVTENYALAKGSVTLYKVIDADVDVDHDGTSEGTAKQTIETKVTYATKTKDDKATIDWDGTQVSKLTNLENVGESVTIVETAIETVAGVDHVGEKTTVYEIKTVNKVTSVYKTVTAIDGTRKVYKADLQGSSYDWIADGEGKLKIDTSLAEVVSDFDWTLDKKDTGYFVVDAKNTATVKALTKAVSYKASNAKDAAAAYIALKISEDGVVDSVKAVKLDTDTKNDTYGEMIDATTKFGGTVTITAPAKKALIFDRSKVDTATTIADTAVMAVTGALKNSEITNLALGDTVTTAKLNKAVYKNNAWTLGETVTLSVADDDNGAQVFKAGANGALSFKVQEIDGDKKLSLTSGTIKLGRGGQDNTARYAYVGDRMITVDNVAGRHSITVTATTSKSGTTYSVGELKEGEIFTVETFGSGASTKKYWRSANNLFCEITTGSGTTMAVYEIKAATTVTSKILEMAGEAASKSNPWTTYTESNATFKETADEGLKLNSTVKGAAVTVDLKLLDNRITSDNKLNKSDADYSNVANTFGTNSNYNFIIDKYLANPAKFNGAAAVVLNANLLDVQEVIGRRWGGGKAYTALGIDIAQAIKATNGWDVTGSLQNDTITGASSGEDWLNGDEGNDSLVGGGATDHFTVGQGQDTVKSYATGKDTIVYDVWAGGAFNGDNISLTGAGDVLLWDDDDADGKYGEDDNSVLLLGMGNKKAVTIAGVNYYFGSGKATKAETFTFDISGTAAAAASKYYGKEGLANIVSIGTDKTKATSKTLGDTLTVDLSDADRYVNIAVADASKSGNRVDLTATAAGSTLKGGTYQSTLRGGAGTDSLVGGSGEDTFWFESLDGQDAISGYAAAKDKVYVKDANVVFSDKNAVAGDVVLSASGTDVVIADAEGKNKVTLQKAADATKAINIMTDAVTKNTLSYYVGANNAKKTNAFTANLGTDMVIDKDGDGKELTTLSLKSYYIGVDAKLDDTLKLASGKTVLTGKKLNMNDIAAHLSSIDVIDTAGLAKGSTIELIGRESGTYTMKGSNNVTENFNLSALKDEKTAGVTNSITITNLAVADVITLGDNIVATKTGGASTKNTYFTLTDKNDSKTSYGTLCVTGVASSKFASNSYTGTIKRS